MKIGWSQKKISLYCYVLTGIVAIIALNIRSSGKILAFIVLAFVIALFSSYINKKINIQNYK